MLFKTKHTTNHYVALILLLAKQKKMYSNDEIKISTYFRIKLSVVLKLINNNLHNFLFKFKVTVIVLNKLSSCVIQKLTRQTVVQTDTN